MFASHGGAEHPVVILGELQHCDALAVVEFLYSGEVRVRPERLEAVLSAAELLGVRPLLEGRPPARPAPAQPSPGPAVARKRRAVEESGRAARPAGRADGRQKPETASPDLDNYNDIRPDILEMIKEEQKVSERDSNWCCTALQAKLLEPSPSWSSHCGPGGAGLPGGAYCYQNQLQSMWQKCWNQNSSTYQVIQSGIPKKCYSGIFILCYPTTLNLVEVKLLDNINVAMSNAGEHF